MSKKVPHGPGLDPGPYPFSPVVEANGFVFLSGQIGDVPGASGRFRAGSGPKRRPRSTTSGGCSGRSGSTTWMS